MKVIKYLYERIEEEIKDAEGYAVQAMKCKDNYPELSRVLFTLSGQELEHSQMLHTEAVDLIKKYRDTEGEPPAAMMAVYDFLHEREINMYNNVKALQERYRNS